MLYLLAKEIDRCRNNLINDERGKSDSDRNVGLRSWSFVIVMVNCLPACRPESKPADEPLPAAKYVQGFSNVDCVTE